MVNSLLKQGRKALVSSTLRQESGAIAAYSSSGDQAGSEA